MDYITVTRYDADADVYAAYHPDLPGCIADGATGDEARANLEAFRAEWIAHYHAHGLTVPPPKAIASGETWRDTFEDWWRK